MALKNGGKPGFAQDLWGCQLRRAPLASSLVSTARRTPPAPRCPSGHCPLAKAPQLTWLHVHHAAQPAPGLRLVHGLHAHLVSGACGQVCEEHAADLRRNADDRGRAALPTAPDSVTEDFPIGRVPGGFQGVGAHVFEAKVPDLGALWRKRIRVTGGRLCGAVLPSRSLLLPGICRERLPASLLLPCCGDGSPRSASLPCRSSAGLVCNFVLLLSLSGTGWPLPSPPAAVIL